MGWETRDYGRDGGRSGRFKAAMGRFFNVENPLAWSLPLYRAFGIQVRIHIIFVLMIISELAWSGSKSGVGLAWTAMALGSLFLLVLLHEYGHCFACRRIGGSADQILMWPLGGLAYCAPPSGWKADLITTLGGPAVNALLWPVFGGILAALVPAHARWTVLGGNPFSPGASLASLTLSDNSRPWWLSFLWWLYYTNAALLLFNMLLPMYPMDGARTVQALIWRRKGQRRATEIVVNVGLVTALVLLVFGLTGNAGGRLVGLALFGGITCWLEKRRLQMTEHPALAGYDFERGYLGMPGEEKRPAGPTRAELRRVQQERDEQAELDRILAKIARSGMAGLTRSEKTWLERATERRRRA